MRKTLIAATIAIFMPTAILVTPAFSTQSGDSLPVEVPKRDPSNWDCNKLGRELEKAKEKQEDFRRKLESNEEAIETRKRQIKTRTGQLISKQNASAEATDRAEKRRINNEIRDIKKDLRGFERAAKRETRAVLKFERKYNLMTHNVKSLKAHIKHNSC